MTVVLESATPVVIPYTHCVSRFFNHTAVCCIHAVYSIQCCMLYAVCCMLYAVCCMQYKYKYSTYEDLLGGAAVPCEGVEEVGKEDTVGGVVWEGLHPE